MSGSEEPRESRWIRAAEVEPGMFVQQPYGGSRGYFKVASGPTEPGADGVFEVTAADGRAGRFLPSSQLRLIRTVAEQRAIEAEHEREAGS